MLEIAKNKWIFIKDVRGMKVVSKDSKHWVVFQINTVNKDEAQCFSEPQPTEEEARNLAINCGNKIAEHGK